jgi:hypothetical protein
MTLPNSLAQKKRAFLRLRESGTADQTLAALLSIGLSEYLSAFERRYFSDEGVLQGLKLVLGRNGEGKTHLLYCMREIALRHDVPVSYVEAGTLTNQPAADFVNRVLERLEVPSDSPDENKMVRLFRDAVARKQKAVLAAGLDPEAIIPAWAEGFRLKPIYPVRVADAVADGLIGAFDNDPARLRNAADKISVPSNLSGSARENDGVSLLKTLPRLIEMLGYQGLMILVDEAETAISNAASKRRQSFWAFLRILSDYVANQQNASSMIVIACNDSLWPDKFKEYDALSQRLSDPGIDTWEVRRAGAQLTPRRLSGLNKIWVRETFAGRIEEYRELGSAIVEMATSVYPDITVEIQLANVERIAEAASERLVDATVKRLFVKALATLLEEQVEGELQREITTQEAAAKLDLAVSDIRRNDESEVS